jgi:hypothetical protein
MQSGIDYVMKSGMKKMKLTSKIRVRVWHLLSDHLIITRKVKIQVGSKILGQMGNEVKIQLRDELHEN